MKTNKNPFLFFMMVLVIVSLACASVGGTPEPEPTSTPLPTNTPNLTEKPTNTPRPTLTPVAGPENFFVEIFGADFEPDNWFNLNLGQGGGEDAKLDIDQTANGLTFEIQDENVYAYFLYTPYIYTDTKLTFVAENQGVNTNNISLVCRFDPDTSSWYEFSFTSSGLWFLYAVNEDGYNIIDNGGSNDLKAGKEVNTFGMTCKDNVITMSVNGNELKSFTDNKYVLEEGFVGFNISSLYLLPVKVEVQSFEIAEP